MIPITTTVDQSQALAAFAALEKVYDDLSPVFEAVGEQALLDMRKRIENHPGPALEPSTIKKKGSTRILRDTDTLYGSFVKGASGNVTRVSPKEGEFGSSVYYGVFHQEGQGVPRRTIIEVTGENEARYSNIASDVQEQRIRELGFEVR